MKANIERRIDAIEEQVLRDAIVFRTGGDPEQEAERWPKAVKEALDRNLIQPGEVLDLLPGTLRDDVTEALRRRLQ